MDQKGSLVAAEKLRFDFSHKSGATDAELRKIEDISTSYIRQNCPVFAEDVPLATARHINGVRAVFGEVYPDPVRVVSVGVPIPDLLENVGDPRWRNVSIEFCGGTHVQKTGDIKELIIIEESGIAKGIRRIIAITGEAAHIAQLEAQVFSTQINHLAALPAGTEKDQRIKQMQTELNELSISTITKAELRERFSKIHKENLEAQKARQKAETKAAIEAITRFFSAPENQNHDHLVIRLPGISSASPKTISDVLNHVKSKNKDKSVYAFAAAAINETKANGGTHGVEEGQVEETKVAHGCYVSTSHTTKQGIEANEWTNQVCKVLGGKAGGKGGVSQGVVAIEMGRPGIVDVDLSAGRCEEGKDRGDRRDRGKDKVDQAIDVAEEWIREKMKL